MRFLTILAAFVMPYGAAAQDEFSALDTAVQAGEFGDTTSILVQDGKGVVFERHFGASDPRTRHNTRSVTKTITGALVGIAIEEGHIASIDAPVLSFFAGHDYDHPSARKSEMALRDLITMTGPLECNDWNSFSQGNEERMYLREDWVGFFLDLPLGAPPPWEPRADQRPYGKVFSYCTAGVFMLGRIVEIATGRELETYAREKLFDPLGIGDVEWAFSPRDIAQGGGGLQMTTRDLARFGRLFAEGGTVDGRRILPREWVEASVTAAARVNERSDYGYLWWLYDMPGSTQENTMWQMSGSGGNKVIVMPELDTVAVITTINFRRSDAHELSDRILSEYIIPAVRNRVRPLP